jgi:ribosomal protein L11 methyltransferase
MTSPGGLWSIRVSVPFGEAEQISAIEAALEPFAVALSSFEVEGGPAWAVEALSDGEPDRHAIRGALAGTGIGDAAVAMAALPERDWVVESQSRLPPLQAGRFFVHGSHFSGAAPHGSSVLQIDAGLAFGTGRHETTSGCLLVLDELAGRRRFSRPLDMGCGSGILALAMAQLWDVPVLACDNDGQAVAVARENAALNGLDRLVRVVKSQGYATSAIRRSGPFDLIVANILARPLCRLARGLARHLTDDGVAILSGLLVGQEEEVLAAHHRHGVGLVDRKRLGDWSVLVLSPDT